MLTHCFLAFLLKQYSLKRTVVRQDDKPAVADAADLEAGNDETAKSDDIVEEHKVEPVDQREEEEKGTEAPYEGEAHHDRRPSVSESRS